MRLRKEQIEFISTRLANELLARNYVSKVSSSGDFDLKALLRDEITKELGVEETLDEEVREILKEFESTMDRERVEYHRMFKLIKSKLAKERNIVL